MRKVVSGLLLLTAVSVGLGAFGHGHQWQSHVRAMLPPVDPRMLALLEFVWYWVSGAMLTLGALLVWAWWRLQRGDTRGAVVAWVVGLFYLLAGVYGAMYVGRFFLVFVVQAVLLFGTAWLLTKPLKRAA